MDPVAIQIVVLVILLLLSAFFSSAETCLTTVNKIRMRTLAEDGNKTAKLVIHMTEMPSKMLSAILVGNNIVNIAASALTTTIAYQLQLGSWIALATGILTLFILIFGEITPKTVATIHADKMALLYARPIHFFMIILTPICVVINAISRAILFILRIDPNAKADSMTEDELRTIVDVSHEDGILEDEEKEMIYNVFDLGDAKAKDVMVPKVHVTFVDVACTYKELLDIFREDKFTRLPVYEETTDNVIGTIQIRFLSVIFCVKHISHMNTRASPSYWWRCETQPSTLLSYWMNTVRQPVLLHWKIFWKKLSEKSTMNMMRTKKNSSRK